EDEPSPVVSLDRQREAGDLAEWRKVLLGHAQPFRIEGPDRVEAEGPGAKRGEDPGVRELRAGRRERARQAPAVDGAEAAGGAPSQHHTPAHLEIPLEEPLHLL